MILAIINLFSSLSRLSLLNIKTMEPRNLKKMPDQKLKSRWQMVWLQTHTNNEMYLFEPIDQEFHLYIQS